VQHSAQLELGASVLESGARAPSARKRSPRGANREAVLRVVGERPGVTAAELSAASGVHHGTLSTLLRTLISRGEVEKRPRPGGRIGYALAASTEGQDRQAVKSNAPPTAVATAPTPATGEPRDNTKAVPVDPTGAGHSDRDNRGAGATQRPAWDGGNRSARGYAVSAPLTLTATTQYRAVVAPSPGQRYADCSGRLPWVPG
jgi:hypothetical protein